MAKDREELIQDFIAERGHAPNGEELYHYASEVGEDDLAEQLWTEDPEMSISDSQLEAMAREESE